jgi:hypothetical protein
MFRFLCAATALTALIASGIVHGFWTGRWSSAAVPGEIALDQVPLELGEWEGVAVETTTPPPEPMLGELYRRYRHRRTGAVVSISLIYGRPGPVSIHTPDVCYGASGYKVGKPAKISPAGTGAEFLTAVASKKRTTEQTNLRIFWTWNAGGRWQVADNPRLTFARFPSLCKLYLVREIASPGEPADDDACVDLMRQLLPELQKVTRGS